MLKPDGIASKRWTIVSAAALTLCAAAVILYTVASLTWKPADTTDASELELEYAAASAYYNAKLGDASARLQNAVNSRDPAAIDSAVAEVSSLRRAQVEKIAVICAGQPVSKRQSMKTLIIMCRHIDILVKCNEEDLQFLTRSLKFLMTRENKTREDCNRLLELGGGSEECQELNKELEGRPTDLSEMEKICKTM